MSAHVILGSPLSRGLSSFLRKSVRFSSAPSSASGVEDESGAELSAISEEGIDQEKIKAEIHPPQMKRLKYVIGTKAGRDSTRINAYVVPAGRSLQLVILATKGT